MPRTGIFFFFLVVPLKWTISKHVLETDIRLPPLPSPAFFLERTGWSQRYTLQPNYFACPWRRPFIPRGTHWLRKCFLLINKLKMLLRCDSHNIKWRNLKWTVLWPLMPSRCCTSDTCILSPQIFITPKEDPVSTKQGLSFPHLLPPVPGNYKSNFCLHGFLYSEHFI